MSLKKKTERDVLDLLQPGASYNSVILFYGANFFLFRVLFLSLISRLSSAGHKEDERKSKPLREIQLVAVL